MELLFKGNDNGSATIKGGKNLNQAEYRQTRLIKDVYEEKLEKIKKKHMSDESLFHPIGADYYCRYCEEFRKNKKQLESIMQRLTKYEQIHEVKKPDIQKVTAISKNEKTKRRYQVYSLLFKDGAEYLVYTFSEEAGCRLLGRKFSELRKAIPIASTYYFSIYLEQEDGSIISVGLLLRELSPKKSWLLAEKQQTRVRVRGTCFNEKPFEYFKYIEGQFNCLQKFCEMIDLKKTKKFSKNGKVAFETKRGMIELEYGQVLLKLFSGIYMVISEEEFSEYFMEDESLVWMKKE